MSQHFLLSPQAKTLSLKQVYKMTDGEVFETFKKIRFSENDGNPICPYCTSKDKFWFIQTRKSWRCAACKKTFTLTSNTLFAHHKLSLQDYLAAIVFFSNGAKGISALHLSRDLQVQYKTAYVLMHKMREAMQREFEDPITGEVEVDGAYFGGYIKPENNKQDRIDRRLAENQNGKRRCVMVLKSRDEENGAFETRVSVTKKENPKFVRKFIKKNVDKKAVIYTDEHTAYDQLVKNYQVKRVNHKIQYLNPINGACINHAESYFSRLRRAEIGVYHHIAGKYLNMYATEMAYREDYCRVDNGGMVNDIALRALHKRPSAIFCGYWQRHLKKKTYSSLCRQFSK